MFKLGFNKIFAVAAVVGLLIFFHLLKVSRPLENVMSSVLNPIFRTAYSLSYELRTAYDSRTSKVDLSSRVKELEARVIRLTEENVGLKTVREENKVLREHLRFLKTHKYNYIVGNIISRGDFFGLSGRTETATIDRGARDGISRGLAVVSSRGVIVGKVAEVKDTIAKVSLINNSRCRLSVAVLNDSGVSGIAEGELGLTIKMSFIPQEKKIKAGDIIITSGQEESIPRGLIVGKILEVKRESNDLWQTATIDPMVNPDNLTVVSVLLPRE